MSMRPLLHPVHQAVALALLVSSGLAVAQYKVVQADGSVTYTDRPPTTGNARVTPLGRLGTSAAPDTSLPVELRQAMQRYPVVLYTTSDCAPCDSGRKMLQQRGVPYSERRIVSEEDAIALERVVGGRTVPALTIGAQPVRGYSDTEWGAYLDAAGYPRESRLPRNWPVAEPAPVVERSLPVAGTRPAPATAVAAPEAPQPQPEGVRF